VPRLQRTRLESGSSVARWSISPLILLSGLGAMAAGLDGLPLELYCFTSDTRWVEYERIQSDIFDHLFAILPEFGLRVFQQPSGADMQAMGSRLEE